MEVESSFNPTYIGPKTKYGKARGLMQVMPKFWVKEFNLKNKYDLHDIQICIDSGTHILKKYLIGKDYNMKQALYKYVNGDNQYVKDVYECMGKFIVYRNITKIKDQKSITKDEPNPEPVTVSGAPQAVKIAAAAVIDSDTFTHTIKYRGDMLGTIAKWYTGDINNWKKILAANPQIVPERLQIGTKIIIPKELVKTITPMTKEFVTELFKVKEKMNNELSKRNN